MDSSTEQLVPRGSVTSSVIWFLSNTFINDSRRESLNLEPSSLFVMLR